MSKIIAIDIDLTIAQTDLGWLEWLKQSSVFFYEEDYLKDLELRQVDYYLPKYFELCATVEPMDYWKENRTYPTVSLLSGCVEVVEKLYKEGNTIAFVSYCMGCSEQVKNKIRFLKYHFGDIVGTDLHFIATKSKDLVRCDVLIDDRNSFLSSMPEDVQLIKINTPYTQDKKLDREHLLVDNWSQIYKELGEKYV